MYASLSQKFDVFVEKLEDGDEQNV